MRIGYQLLCSYFLAGLLICFFIFTLFVNEVRPYIKNISEQILIDISKVMVKAIEEDIKYDVSPAESRIAQALDRDYLEHYYETIFSESKLFQLNVIDSKGNVVYSSDKTLLGKNLLKWIQQLSHSNSSLSQKTIFVSTPICFKQQQLGVLTLSKNIDFIIDYTLYTNHKLALYSLFLLCFLFLLSGFFVYMLNHAMMKLITYSKALTQGGSAFRPRFISPELNHLACSLEEMKIKLEGKKYIENYVHTLTHELKSPLSSIVAAADIMHESIGHSCTVHAASSDKKEMYLRYLCNIENQAERMRLMIERMLQLARLDSRSGIHFEKVAMERIVNEALVDLSAEVDKKEIRIHIVSMAALEGIGDKFLLKQALINVLSNALDFSTPLGTITIETQAVKSEYTLIIQDSGSGIPDYALPHVLDKFYSLPRANKRKSSGLGLSFVQEVAKLHHGYITINNRMDGQSGVVVKIVVRLDHPHHA